MNIGGVNNSMHWGTLSKEANSKASEESKSMMLSKQNKNSAFEALEKTKENLIKSKEALSEREMDPKEKKEKLDNINKQIAEIEAQIQQAKALEKEKEQEKLKADMEEKQGNKYQSGDEVHGGVIISESLKNIIESRQNINNISDLKRTKASLTVEKGWLTPDDNPNSFVSRQYAKLSKGIGGLEQRISSEASKLYEASTNTNNTKVQSDNNNSLDVKEKDEKENIEKENEK